MKVLVIGGNRFFGKRLVTRLLNNGANITLLNRGQNKDEFGEQVHRIILDRCLLSLSSPAIQGQYWDIIYDQVCFDAKMAKIACEVFKGKVGHYIFTSSMSVYNSGQLISESSFAPKTYSFSTIADSNENYAEAKRQAEAIFFQSNSFPVTAIRFPIVLGEDDYTKRLKFHVDNVLGNKSIFFPNIDAKISLINSMDAAKILEWVGIQSPLGPLNCSSENPISMSELITLIESITHKKAKTVTRCDKGDPSPFGVKADWYMDVKKLKEKCEVMPSLIKDWLPSLINYFANIKINR